MVNLRFGIPLFLLIVHHHVSNSAFGLNNSIVPLAFFFLFLSSMSIFLITNNRLGYSKFIAVLLLFLFLVLWLLNPTLFKDISSLFINFFITFYIIRQRGFMVVKNQLAIIVLASALVGFFQVWGVSPLVHAWNSQFMDERAGYMVRNIEVYNIFQDDLGNTDEFDSRQVRAPGIFHSSAIVSGIFVMYIAFIFTGIYKSLKNYFFIPFLCVLSGSKLVLLSTLIFFLLALFSYRLSVKKTFILIIGSALAVSFHKLMFNGLLDFQFNTDILLYSFDVRFELYAWEFIELESILLYIYLILSLVIGLFIIMSLLNISINVDKVFLYTLSIIAVGTSYFTTPQISNFILGWFFFPVFFVQLNFINSNKRTKYVDRLILSKSSGLSI